MKSLLNDKDRLLLSVISLLLQQNNNLFNQQEKKSSTDVIVFVSIASKVLYINPLENRKRN